MSRQRRRKTGSPDTPSIDPTSRTNQIRSMPFRLDPPTRDDTTGEGHRRIAGLAAPFGSPTRIHAFPDDFTEEYHPGCFRNTLNRRSARQIPLQWNHGHDSAGIGALPVGQWDRLVETRAGLEAEGIVFDTLQTELLIAALDAKAIAGMSIRFDVIREEWIEPTEPGALRHRRLLEVRLLEAGPVAWPAYTDTNIGTRTSPQQLAPLLTPAQRNAANLASGR